VSVQASVLVFARIDMHVNKRIRASACACFFRAHGHMLYLRALLAAHHLLLSCFTCSAPSSTCVLYLLRTTFYLCALLALHYLLLACFTCCTPPSTCVLYLLRTTFYLRALLASHHLLLGALLAAHHLQLACFTCCTPPTFYLVQMRAHCF
jgi:hypothetical protein